jgi:hypothetical protein
VPIFDCRLSIERFDLRAYYKVNQSIVIPKSPIVNLLVVSGDFRLAIVDSSLRFAGLLYVGQSIVIPKSPIVNLLVPGPDKGTESMEGFESQAFIELHRTLVHGGNRQRDLFETPSPQLLKGQLEHERT